MAVLTMRAVALLATGLCACTALLNGQLSEIHCLDLDAFGPPACPIGQTCVSGTCASVGQPVGATCAADADCRAPASCVDVKDVTGSNDKRCLLPCCTSADCLSPARGLACRPLASGPASFCWPANEIPGRAAPGVGLAGATCSQNGDCRSGACEGGHCADTCCSDANCSSATNTCRSKQTTLAQKPIWTCSEGGGELTGGCKSDGDCRSGACSVSIEGEKYCLTPCCSSRECGDVVTKASTYHLACTGAGAQRACGKVLASGANGPVGANCSKDDECRSGLCLTDGNAKYCSDLCCNDASCGDVSRFVCRRGTVGGASPLRCVRK